MVTNYEPMTHFTFLMEGYMSTGIYVNLKHLTFTVIFSLPLFHLKIKVYAISISISIYACADGLVDSAILSVGS